jgi:hypothetical protein
VGREREKVAPSDDEPDIRTDVVHATYINIDCFDKIYFCVIA